MPKSSKREESVVPTSVTGAAIDPVARMFGRDGAVYLNLGRPEDDIGKRIKAAREKKGSSQESLSSATKSVDPDNKGISRSVLAYYEKGRFKPGARELRLLYRTLGVTPNWLVLGEADPERLREMRNRFESDAAFFDEFLAVIKRLDSKSLEAIAHLVFVATGNDAEFGRVFKSLAELSVEASGFSNETPTERKALDKMGSPRQQVKRKK